MGYANCIVRYFETLVTLVIKLCERKHTLTQKINLLLSLFSFLTKRIIVLNYPVRLTIDPSNKCNLKCVLCPVGTNKKGRTRSEMPFLLFQKIIDSVSPYIWEINLYNWGEPLLNNDIFKMIRLASSNKIETNLSSNLSIFNSYIATQLIESGLDRLVVSLPGASFHSTQLYQKKDIFNKIIQNICLLTEKKIMLKIKTPQIIWCFIVTKHNESEIQKAIKIAKDIGVNKLLLSPIRCDMKNELFLNNEQQFAAISPWLPKDSRWSLYDYKKRIKKTIDARCYLPWTEMVINPNGSVSPCCAVWFEQFDFGDLTTATIKDIWNNKSYQDSREIINGVFIQNTKNICSICKKNKAQITFNFEGIYVNLNR